MASPLELMLQAVPHETVSEGNDHAFDIYVKVRGRKMVIVSRVYEPFTKETRRKLLENDIGTLYIRREDLFHA